MMDHPDTKPQGAFSALLADQDLAHLELVLRRSLECDFGGPILLPSYWRERLAVITRASHLSRTQIQTIHRLYLQLDAFEAVCRQRDEERARVNEPPVADTIPLAAASRVKKRARSA